MAGLNPWDYAAKTRKEHAEQVALFMWANMARIRGIEAAADPLSYTKAGYADRFQLPVFGSRYDEKLGRSVAVPVFPVVPELKWLHAVHNQGHGDAIRGAQAKAEGVKAGVADIFLPVPTGFGWDSMPFQFHGLYIELKKKDSGKPHAEQLDFQADMRAAGYKCEIIHGWELARDEILRYLGKL